MEEFNPLKDEIVHLVFADGTTGNYLLSSIGHSGVWLTTEPDDQNGRFKGLFYPWHSIGCICKQEDACRYGQYHPALAD